MKLKDRIKAEESPFGKFLVNWVGKLLLVCSAIGAANEYFILIPSDFIPQWLKFGVAICGVVGFVGGKLTVKDELKKQ